MQPAPAMIGLAAAIDKSMKAAEWAASLTPTEVTITNTHHAEIFAMHAEVYKLQESPGFL